MPLSITQILRLPTLAAFFFALSACALPAQGLVTKDQLDKRSQKQYEQAESYARSQQRDKAKAELDAILTKTPTAIDALLFRAEIYYDLGQLPAAEADFSAALALSATYHPPVLYKLGLTEFRQEKYAPAVAHYEAYLAQAAADDRRRERVARYLIEARTAAELKAAPVPFDPQPLGPQINTKGKEYLPSFTADGRYLIYTVNYTGQEDLYFSQRNDQGEWTPGAPVPGVNTPQDEGAESISADGKLLFFTGCYRSDSYGGCDLYYSEQQNGSWGNIHHAAEPLNTAYYESQPSLAANGQYLYFTSNRPGGLGGNDIWRCARRPDGRWGKPENVGAPINTAGDDESPFLHPDGQTLYFMSNGHPGLGSYDLFVARRTADGPWGQPKNLGYPINTAAGEGALVVSLDGQTAYYTTDQNTQQGEPLDLDIYQFSLYAAARPQPVTYVHGRVLDTADRPLAGTQVTVTQEDGNQPLASLTTDASGEFLVVLPAGQNYRLEATKTGYLFYSDSFELNGAFTREEPYELAIALQVVPTAGLAVGDKATPVVLRNVLFATGSAELLPASTPELDQLVRLLQTYPQLRIRINGHTDNVGEQAANQVLSEARARSVYTYLAAKGIAAERLRYQGFGESRPLTDNTTEEGRARNRRTEFEVE